jgi:hypothetical protein
MTHDPAVTLASNEDAQTADEPIILNSIPESNVLDTIGDDETAACNNNNNHSDLDIQNKAHGTTSPPHTEIQQEERTHHCLSSTSSSTSSVSSTPQSTTTSESTSPSSALPDSSTTTVLPIWADPIKVQENPTRYKVIQDYMTQHKLSYTSPLPLNKDIVFYFGDTKTTMVNYRSSMQKLFTSSTVWQFGSYWRRYKETLGRKPSQMMTNQNLYCFEKGVEPMWEDEMNKNGGRLIVCPGKCISLDDLFDWLLCAFVGGQLTAEGMVGLVLSRRARFDRIELWLDASSSKNSDTIVSIR